MNFSPIPTLNFMKIILLGASIVLSGCGPGPSDSDDGEVDGGGDGGSDEFDIPAPTLCDVNRLVLAGDCVSCHGAGANPPELTLDAAKSGLVGVQSSTYSGKTLVVANAPEESLLYRKVHGSQASDEGAAMPLGGSLSTEKTSLIERWIQNEATTTCE